MQGAAAARQHESPPVATEDQAPPPIPRAPHPPKHQRAATTTLRGLLRIEREALEARVQHRAHVEVLEAGLVALRGFGHRRRVHRAAAAARAVIVLSAERMVLGPYPVILLDMKLSCVNKNVELESGGGEGGGEGIHDIICSRSVTTMASTRESRRATQGSIVSRRVQWSQQRTDVVGGACYWIVHLLCGGAEGRRRRRGGGVQVNQTETRQRRRRMRSSRRRRRRRRRKRGREP